MEPTPIPSTDDELSDHGVDEYVSDCNRLPFADMADSKITLGGIVGCVFLLLAVCGGVYGLCRLITLIIR